MPAYYSAMDPARYQMQQQSRKDRQLQALMNIMLAMKQMKQKKSMWGEEMDLNRRKQQLAEQRLQTMTPYYQAQQEQWKWQQRKPSNLREKYDLLVSLGYSKKEAALIASNYKPSSQDSFTAYQRYRMAEDRKKEGRNIVKGIKKDVDSTLENYMRSNPLLDEESMKSDPVISGLGTAQTNLKKILAKRVITDKDIENAMFYADILKQISGRTNITTDDLISEDEMKNR